MAAKRTPPPGDPATPPPDPNAAAQAQHAPAMQQLQAAGVIDPDHLTTASKAMALGFSPTEIIGWTREHGKEVLDLVESIFVKFGHKGGGTPPPPPAP